MYSLEFMLTMYFHRADIVNYADTFELLKYLANETEYIVWDRVASSIAYVRDMLASDSTIYSKFQVSILSWENLLKWK